MAASMSRASSLRVRVPSTTSPVARAPPAHRIRGTRMCRSVCPCGDVCTCTARIHRPLGRTTCRSPCRGISAAVAPGVRLHAPERVLLPFDRADLVERLDLVVGQIRPPPERTSVGFREIHVEDVAAVDLPPDRDAVHGDRDFLSLVRTVEALLPAPDRLDSAQRSAIRAPGRLARTDFAREHYPADG